MSKNEYICDCSAIHKELVDQTLKAMLPGTMFKQISGFYKILADETRCRIVFALLQSEMCVCDLSCLLSMTKSSISHQLKKMREHGVVRHRRSGKEIYYSLNDNHIEEIFTVTMAHIAHMEVK